MFNFSNIFYLLTSNDATNDVSGVFIVNFKHVSNFALAFSLRTFNKEMTSGNVLTFRR